MNPKVDQYLVEGCMRCPLGATPACKVNDWQDELRYLRRLILNCGLTEELKWGAPCYTYQGKNVLMLSALKEFTAISFFKGSLLKDSDHLLIAPGKNSQAARYIKVTDSKQVLEQEKSIKACIFEAVEVEKAGLKVAFKKNLEPIPEEFQQALDENPALRTAFEALTPGRQQGYILHFSQPKQSKTRVSRIEKYVPKILAGKGFHDR